MNAGIEQFRYDQEAQEKFLRHYAETGLLYASAAFCGGYCPNTIKDFRKVSPAFNMLAQDAKQTFNESLEREMYRRAVEGVEEPVFYQGQKLEHKITRYSDRLMEVSVRGNIPEKYKENYLDPHAGSSTGVMVVPLASSPDEWQELAIAQQRELNAATES